MKFIQKIDSKSSDNPDVYEIKAHKKELEIMLGLTQNALVYTPKILETMQTRARLRDMSRNLKHALGIKISPNQKEPERKAFIKGKINKIF